MQKHSKFVVAWPLRKGKDIREVARLVGASPSSVWRWNQALQEGGLEALKAKPHPGPPPRLSPQQKDELEATLLRRPRAAGFPTDLWTLARVAKVILSHLGVNYHPGHIWRILRRMGWSGQKSERRARERNEKAIERWAKEQWPRLKKRPARRVGASS